LHLFDIANINVNAQNHESETPIMKGVGNIIPQVMEQFLQYPNLNIQIINKYKQNVMDIVEIREKERNLDPRVKSLIKAAYENSTNKYGNKVLLRCELEIDEQIKFLKKNITFYQILRCEEKNTCYFS
jgi:hypothetical protein